MIVRKTLSLGAVLRFAGHHLWWLTSYMLIVSVLYGVVGWQWISIPWLPVSLIGTALAFYIGFKNNQSYDRVWEARKIWGAIVNSSRSWGVMVNSFVRNSQDTQLTERELLHIKQTLIYRHIAWLYILRDQLLVPTQWEHASLRGLFGKMGRRRQEYGGIGLFKDYLNAKQREKYFSDEADWKSAANKATQIINLQSLKLAELEEKDILHMRRQLDMQKVLSDFYDHQGRAERIKKFPLPRQYANLSFIFNCIFIFLLPLGIVAEFAKLGEAGVWLMIPFGTVVGWIYVVMELIGDYSENPFEGFGTDVPMLSICRTIEIDLLHILGETDIPKPIQPVNDILM
ncbi:putative membrane protein [Chryseobacterium defluvii]|uniref:Putative membrane protein n=1 Tax=Chryseobacterium defluvii TaxID=160396 RepID=A0A840K852_9FLAO|nr:bestrophin family ion channel [Chryseobacterium defluvii]MBB4805396.1 putative membrane protein [Chryseobacterium defluvii]